MEKSFMNKNNDDDWCCNCICHYYNYITTTTKASFKLSHWTNNGHSFMRMSNMWRKRSSRSTKHNWWNLASDIASHILMHVCIEKRARKLLFLRYFMRIEQWLPLIRFSCTRELWYVIVLTVWSWRTKIICDQIEGKQPFSIHLML